LGGGEVGWRIDGGVLGGGGKQRAHWDVPFDFFRPAPSLSITSSAQWILCLGGAAEARRRRTGVEVWIWVVVVCVGAEEVGEWRAAIFGASVVMLVEGWG